MEIFLVRHTSVNIDKEVCYGFSDVELSINYKKEVKLLSKKLDITRNTVFYTSPLQRCKTIANILSDNNYTIDNRIKEINFGKWELTRWSDIEADELNCWIEDFINIQCPEGESFMDLYNRSINFYTSLVDKRHEQVILIAHGGVIKSILAYILSIPLIKAHSISIDFGGVSKIMVSSKITQVLYINK